MTSVSKLILVLLSAPVLQTLPKGTKFPNTSLPLIEGLLYSISISVKPTICSTSEAGLTLGVLI